MTEESRPESLLRLGQPRRLERRKSQRRFPPPPARQRAQHAARLRTGALQAVAHLHEAERAAPALATEVPYVRLQPAPGTLVTEQDVKSLGLVPILRREDSVIAAYAVDRNLSSFQQRLARYEASPANRLQAISKFDSVSPWSREERTSPRLREIELEPDRPYTVDVLLLPLEGERPNRQALRAVETFVERQQGQVLDRSLAPNFAALRVRLGGQALDTLLEYRDDIAWVDVPPRVHLPIHEAVSFSLDDLPAEIPGPAEDMVGICVVDSGLVEGHPLLAPAIASEKSRSFPESLGPPVPTPPVGERAGHGTRVAGIALYGDLAAAIAQKRIEPGAILFNARMLDDNAELSEERMPFLRDVVEHFGDVCRIFNLSLGLDHCGTSLSIHAVELDTLARERNALFIVSSGNVTVQDIAERFPKQMPPYPDFLHHPPWRVRMPAEALNALTIGGITPDATAPLRFPERKAVAPGRAPSPFNCSGGLKNVLKPELVEVAGNLAFDSNTKQWVDNEALLRVSTTSHQIPGRLLGYDHGTSFAAPKVAYLAAQLLRRYPEASANLVRALLVQSAGMPQGVEGWPIRQQMRLCGFGVPNLDRALYCRPQRATLYFEGEIVVDEVLLFDIPVPPEFSRAKGRKDIIITVAYDPPVSAVEQGRPAGISLEWNLARGDVSEDEIEEAIAKAAEEALAGESVDEAQEETSPPNEPGRKKNVFLKGTLPRRIQQRGTVRKNIFSWKRGEYGDTYRLAIIAKAARPAHAGDRQRLAVVVTLECEDSNIQVYNAVRARLAGGRVRVRASSGLTQ